jgi:hypothetical protein
MAGEETSAAYAAMIAEAEAAVAAVKDPELRRVAFDRILATLLERKEPTRTLPKGKTHGRPRATAQLESDRAAKARGGPKRYVEDLLKDGFFEKQRTIADVKAELANRGRHIALTSLSGPLQTLTQQRKLRRQKISAKDGQKSTYAYSNW